MKNLRHIAIIMDGNGRWAEQRKESRLTGHRAGVDSVYGIVDYAVETKLSILTLFAFSCENWNRPTEEIDNIFELLKIFISKNIDYLSEKNVKICILGRKDNITSTLREILNNAEIVTQNNTGLKLNIAFNYSGRDEIIRAIKKIINNKISATEISEANFVNFLDTEGLVDPDLIIRTGGEMRLSNFLLWQMAYSELYFCKNLWPDFSVEDFKQAISSYYNRKRRFGKLEEDRYE